MIKAGSPVDEMIEKIIPLLDPKDIIIDGGNSYYKDTIRRSKYLFEKGFEFVGMGVSGGEEGRFNIIDERNYKVAEKFELDKPIHGIQFNPITNHFAIGR